MFLIWGPLRAQQRKGWRLQKGAKILSYPKRIGWEKGAKTFGCSCGVSWPTVVGRGVRSPHAGSAGAGGGDAADPTLPGTGTPGSISGGAVGPNTSHVKRPGDTGRCLGAVPAGGAREAAPGAAAPSATAEHHLVSAGPPPPPCPAARHGPQPRGRARLPAPWSRRLCPARAAAAPRSCRAEAICSPEASRGT